MVEALAAILPDHAVGACLVPEPGTASHGQVVVKRLPQGAVASPPGIDPTRVFPGLTHERVAPVPGSTTGSTLHVASDDDAVDGDGSAAVAPARARRCRPSVTRCACRVSCPLPVAARVARTSRSA